MKRAYWICLFSLISILIIASYSSATINTIVESDPALGIFTYHYQLQNDSSVLSNVYISEWSISFSGNPADPIVGGSITKPDNWMYEYTGSILRYSIDRVVLSNAEVKLMNAHNAQSAAQSNYLNLLELDSQYRAVIAGYEAEILMRQADIQQLYEAIAGIEEQMYLWTQLFKNGDISEQDFNYQMAIFTTEIANAKESIVIKKEHIKDLAQQKEETQGQLDTLQPYLVSAQEALEAANSEVSTALLDVKMLSGVATGDILSGFGFSSLYAPISGVAAVTYENALGSSSFYEPIALPGNAAAPVAEPASMLLLVSGLVGLAGFSRPLKKE